MLLLDVELDGLSGVEVARRLRAAASPVRILILSSFSNEQYIRELLLETDVAGYLTKKDAAREVVDAVLKVARGERGVIAPAVAQTLIGIDRQEQATPPLPEMDLSERELEVLRLLARGYDNREIAEALFISYKTVKNHVASIYDKLDVHTARAAAAWAWQHGLVEGEEGSEEG